MSKFTIVCGGECKIDKIPPKLFDGAYVIAADSGYDTAVKLGVPVDLLLGDMDSIKAVPSGIEIYRVKAEKDDTDTMLAISVALERGADEIILIGGGGGRLDHLLSNIFMLESLTDKGIRAKMYDGVNEVSVISDSTALIPNSVRYFGIIPLEDSVVSASGCKYPLDKALLKRAHPYAVSNEVTSDFATVNVIGKAIISITL